MQEYLVLYSHMLQLYTYTYYICMCMQNQRHNNKDAMIKTSEDLFKKIYLSLYLKGLCVRGSWRLNKDCNILTSLAPPDIAVCRSRSPGLLLNRRPGGSAFCWLSLPHLVSNSSDLQLAEWWLSLPHLVSNVSGPQLIGGPEGPFCRAVAFPTTSFL